jgi:hypothetical protein
MTMTATLATFFPYGIGSAEPSENSQEPLSTASPLGSKTSIEGEIEKHADQIRIRLRLCRAGEVLDSYRHTFAHCEAPQSARELVDLLAGNL